VESYEKECDFNGLQKHLLFILLFGRKYPNSGQIRSQLNDFYGRIEQLLNEKDLSKGAFVFEEVDLGDDYAKANESNSEKEDEKDSSKNIFSAIKRYKYSPIYESIHPMVAIATQIASENITAAHYALRIVSRLIDTMEDDDPDKRDIIRKVSDKLRKQHNTPYLEIWLQNMTYSTDKVKDESHYTLELCRLVMGEDICLWNNNWLSPTLHVDFPYNSICDETSLKNISPVIKIKSKWQYDV